jgi:hypothetical protein
MYQLNSKQVRWGEMLVFEVALWLGEEETPLTRGC